MTMREAFRHAIFRIKKGADLDYRENKFYLEGIEKFSRHKPTDILLIGDSHISNARERFPWTSQGIGGDTTLGVLNRIGYAIRLHPKTVFVEIGLNDVCGWVSSDRIVRNIKMICNLLWNNGAHVYLFNIFRVREGFQGHEKINQRIDLINRELAKIPCVIFIELRFEDHHYREDNSHLSDAGYERFKQEIEKFLQ